MSMKLETNAKRKKKVSKNKKSSWRKHTDVSDVEQFLEEKRTDQILGVDKLDSKPDNELFILDTQAEKPKPRTREEKKAWAKELPYYQQALFPKSSVEDPIKKRNRVRTKEERQHPARKAKIALRKAQGKLSRKEAEALEHRKRAIKDYEKSLVKRRTVKFDKDIWNTDGEKSIVDDSWLCEDAKRQAKMAAGEFKVKPPVDLAVPKSRVGSDIANVDAALSYNPTLKDHQALIGRVVVRELEMMKAEAHLDRVTKPTKVTREQKQSDWVEEMMEGLYDDNEKVHETTEVEELQEEDENIEEKKPAGSKATVLKRKTRKQRRAKKRLRREAHARKHAAVEKRKTTDIFRVKRIVSELDEKGTIEADKFEKKKVAKLEHQLRGTKRLSKVKYQEPLEDFSSPYDLTGSLRKIRSKSTILRDRFQSLQKRNILQPTEKIFKLKKRKVKVVVKRDQRIEDEEINKYLQKRKLKIINAT